MSEARLQKLLVLFFILAVFGMGLNHLKEKNDEGVLESAEPTKTEDIRSDRVEVDPDGYEDFLFSSF